MNVCVQSRCFETLINFHCNVSGNISMIESDISIGVVEPPAKSFWWLTYSVSIERVVLSLTIFKIKFNILAYCNLILYSNIN